MNIAILLIAFIYTICVDTDEGWKQLFDQLLQTTEKL